MLAQLGALADGELFLGWRYDLPGWSWAIIVLAAGAGAWFSYTRLLGARRGRVGLAAVRALVIVAIAVLLAGPVIVRMEEQIERDVLLVLVDRSASMQVVDTPGSAEGEWISRDEALRRGLTEQLAALGEDGAGRERDVLWMGFGEETFDLGAVEGSDDIAAWPDADLPAMQLRTALEQAVERAGGRPISGIVLMSDGRSPQPLGSELLARLQREAVGVYPVPLGSDTLPLDIRLVRVDHPEQAFADDAVTVTAVAEQFGGGDGEVAAADVVARLVDIETNEVLAEADFADAGMGEAGGGVRLETMPDEPGPRRWRVEIDYQGDTASDAPPMMSGPGRTALVDLEIVDRPIRVLYVEGYPRWEYRYLTSMLTREDSIESSIFLVSADRDFAQEGDEPITRLPRDRDEIADYDVLILGDVDARQLGDSLMELIREQVADAGAGLLLIGGEHAMPITYTGSPLGELMPMQSPGAVEPLLAGAADAGLRLAPTNQARALNVMELRGPVARNGEPDAGWPDVLPPLEWGQRLGDLKPAADVLAHVHPANDPDAPGQPLIARMRYGAGQSVFIGTDETWRWRFGRGELYFEQFWIQMVRMLGRDRLGQGEQRARLDVSSRRMQLGDQGVVELVLQDPALIDQALDRVRVSVAGADDDDQILQQLELHPVGDADDGQRRIYRGMWRARHAGQMVLAVDESALDDVDGLRQIVEVAAPTDQLRNPEPDHDRLAALADRTGGQMVALDELDRLAELVPNRARRTPVDEREPIWNTGWSLLIVLALLSIEWIGRKLLRLA